MYNIAMKIGIFGGSFDPVHLGHIAAARSVKQELGLDKLFMVVAADAPHKHGARLPGNVRLRLLEASLEGEEGIMASDAELKRGGKSYTLDTVSAFAKQYRGAELYFIVGGDMLESFPTWREPKGILEKAALVAVSRPDAVRDMRGIADSIMERFGGSVIVSSFTGPDISSTEVRRRMLEAEPVRGLVTRSCEEYMYKNAVYMPEELRRIRQKLRQRLKRKRLDHTMMTVLEAVRLAYAYGVDTQKARLAALLHDCIKLPNKEIIEFCDGKGFELTPAERDNPYLIHARVGALLARDEFGVTDDEVLSAIRLHTLGRVGMTPLDMVVYVADKIEPSREYDGLDEIRSAAYRNLALAMLMVMRHSAEYTLKSGRSLNPATGEVMRWLEEESSSPRYSVKNSIQP